MKKIQTLALLISLIASAHLLKSVAYTELSNNSDYLVIIQHKELRWDLSHNVEDTYFSNLNWTGNKFFMEADKIPRVYTRPLIVFPGQTIKFENWSVPWAGRGDFYIIVFTKNLNTLDDWKSGKGIRFYNMYEDTARFIIGEKQVYNGKIFPVPQEQMNVFTERGTGVLCFDSLVSPWRSTTVKPESEHAATWLERAVNTRATKRGTSHEICELRILINTKGVPIFEATKTKAGWWATC